MDSTGIYKGIDITKHVLLKAVFGCDILFDLFAVKLGYLFILKIVFFVSSTQLNGYRLIEISVLTRFVEISIVYLSIYSELKAKQINLFILRFVEDLEFITLDSDNVLTSTW